MGAVVRAFGLIAAATLCAGLAAGCGDDDGTPVASESTSPSAAESATPEPSPSVDEPSETPAPPSWPACGATWVAGADLPKPYDGCAQGDTAVPAEALHCSMGALLVTYDDRFWGVPGHVISEADGALAKDPGFRQARAACTA
jgi:hypothetical protein